LVDWIHGQAYKQPEAVRDYRKVTFDCQHSDIFLANRQWFPEGTNWEATHYAAFFVAAQRLAIVPQVRHSLIQTLEKDGDPIVFINPHKAFSEKEVSLFHNYISQGGKALILDSSERGKDSFARQLIGPLSAEIIYTQPSGDEGKENKERAKYIFSEDKDDKRSVSFSTQGICEVRGGQPRLWYTLVQNNDDGNEERWKPCLTEVPSGKGRVWVCTLSRAFSGAGLGNTSTIPNKDQQNIYRLVYKILIDLAGQ
jgi:hypothetical protein